MEGKNLSNICTTVMNFFNKTVVEADKAVKFSQRKSKLNGRLFAEVLVSGCLSDPRISLERLCQLIKERKVTITKQGLHQRFTAEATALMKMLFRGSQIEFKTEKKEVLELLKPFSSIKMQDSSGISLPSQLKQEFKGWGGGKASEAGIKLHVMYDYLRGQLDKVTMTEGCRSDQGFNGHLEAIEKGALYLQDLGYFKLKFFEEVRAKEAYFISRYSYPTGILTEQDEMIDLLQELRKGDVFFSKDVRLGKKEKIEVRLIGFRLSEEEVEKRLRKIKEKARQRGRRSAQATLELAKWSLYITNVPEKLLTNDQVHAVYSLRWQIELFFKLCKSEAGIDKVSGNTSDRILCELYAKLICVVMLFYVCFPIRWKDSQEISFYKAYKGFKLKAREFFKALPSRYRLIAFIKEFVSEVKNFAFKDKYRRKRRLAYQKIMDAVGQEILIGVGSLA